MSPEAHQHIISCLLYPVFQTFTGGQAISKDELKALYAIWIPLISGYEPESYQIAARKMLMERTDRFRPVPAEVRDYLKKAEAEFYARSGLTAQERDPKVLLDRVWKTLTRQGAAWDPRIHGPAPGEHGCRLDAQDIANVLRTYLKANDARLLPIRCFSQSVANSIYGDSLMQAVYRRLADQHILKCFPALEGYPAHAAVLAELGMSDERERADAQIEQLRLC
jgi:hypothetical protein